MDAADIAKQFEDKGADDTKSNNRTDASEKAENSNVTVIVGDDGNYKVIVKKDIDHTDRDSGHLGQCDNRLKWKDHHR